MGEIQKILVVGDLETRKEKLSALKKITCAVIREKTCEDALAALKHDSDIALVLLDLDFLGETGFDFLRKLNDNLAFSWVPVVVETSHSDAENEVRALALGAADVLKKPYDLQVFRQRIANILRQKQREREQYENENKEKLEQAYYKLKYRTEHDYLTGLCNRECFYEKTEAMLEKYREEEFLIITINIDRFKVINELFGWDVGDRIICKIADTLKACLRDIGTCGRLGGDHFVFCCPQSKVNMEDIVAFTDQTMAVFNLNYTITCNFGVYRIEDRALPLDIMVDRGMMALKTIKGNYLKRYALYDDRLRDTLLREQRIVNDMNAALENKEFLVCLQPIYSLNTFETVSAEALVRWNHPELGFLSPGVFIPIFERNGFIVKLDAFVWEFVCHFIRECMDLGLPQVPISINISRLNLHRSTVCKEIKALVEKYGIDPSLLKLEITESAFMDDPQQLIREIKKLREAGFKILMDDFGSGYSSLNLLKDVPMDILKIDMAFIQGVGVSSRADNVVSSVVRMAKWLDMEIVAEGVENQDQVDFLRKIDCDFGQGYFYEKPMPIEDFKKLLLKYEDKPVLLVDEQAFENFDFEALWEMDSQMKDLFYGILDGMGFYELYADSLEVIQVNAGYYEMLGSSPSLLFSDTMGAYSKVYEEDKEALLNTCKLAMETNQIERVVIRRFHEKGRLMWLEMKVRFLGKRRNRALLFIAINDLTEAKEKENAAMEKTIADITKRIENERELQYKNELSQMLLEESDTLVSDYNRETDTLVYSGRRPDGKRVEKTVTDCVKNLSNNPAIHSDDRDKFKRVYMGMEDNVLNERLEFQADFFGDGFHWYRATYRNIRDEQGEVYRVLGFSYDIQTEKELGDALEREKGYAAAMMEDGLFVYDIDFDNMNMVLLHKSSKYAEDFFDVEDYILFERNKNLLHPDDRQALKEKSDFITLYYRGRRDLKKQVRIKNRQGQWIWVEYTIKLVYNKTTASIHGIGVIRKIDELRLLTRKAERDGLTGLYNRGTTEELVHKSLKKNTKGALFVLDVDDFKYINDTYGHSAGDKVLKRIGTELENSFRNSDIVGRIGGDEFVIYMIGVVDKDVLEKKAETILENVRGIGKKMQLEKMLSVSIGIAMAPGDGTSFSNLYKVADTFLYVSKEMGKNGFFIGDK